MPALSVPPRASALLPDPAPHPGSRDPDSAPEQPGRPSGELYAGVSGLGTSLSQIPGSQVELRLLVQAPSSGPVLRQLHSAACVGCDADVYHPDEGTPGELALARCSGCPARLACLALALRAEDPETRSGWYGGIGPADRSALASSLGVDFPTPPRVPDIATRAIQLRAAGWTIPSIAAELKCSDRTVQRYLRKAAA